MVPKGSVGLHDSPCMKTEEERQIGLAAEIVNSLEGGAMWLLATAKRGCYDEGRERVLSLGVCTQVTTTRLETC